MSARLACRMLAAAALVGLSTHGALAQSAPRVKIINGPRAAAALARQSDDAPLLGDDAPPADDSDGSDFQPIPDAATDSPFQDDAAGIGTSAGGCCQSPGGCAVDGQCQGDCGGDCDQCARPFGFSAGIEATYLNPGYERSNPGLDPGDGFQYQSAPRAWLQWQGPRGWGVRGRFWDLDALQTQVGAGNFEDLLAARTLTDSLDVYAVDLELTKNFFMNGAGFCASFGARNGRLRRNLTQHFSIFDVAGGGGDDASYILQEVERDFKGTGFTAALGIRQPLGQTRLAAICNLRGSALWGGNDLNQSLTVAEVVPVGAGNLDVNDFQQIEASDSNGAGMWIGEIQAGGEWSTPLSAALGGGQGIVQVLFEAQWWNLPGVSASGSPFSTSSQWYDFMGVTAVVGFTR